MVRKKVTTKPTTRLSEENFHIIVEGLKVATEDEHTPLVMRFDQAISA